MKLSQNMKTDQVKFSWNCFFNLVFLKTAGSSIITSGFKARSLQNCRDRNLIRQMLAYDNKAAAEFFLLSQICFNVSAKKRTGKLPQFLPLTHCFVFGREQGEVYLRGKTKRAHRVM